jgi:hypothetical protein
LLIFNLFECLPRMLRSSSLKTFLPPASITKTVKDSLDLLQRIAKKDIKKFEKKNFRFFCFKNCLPLFTAISGSPSFVRLQNFRLGRIEDVRQSQKCWIT